MNCPHCDEPLRTWGEMDTHLKFRCPYLRAYTALSDGIRLAHDTLRELEARHA